MPRNKSGSANGGILGKTNKTSFGKCTVTTKTSTGTVTTQAGTRVVQAVIVGGGGGGNVGFSSQGGGGAGPEEASPGPCDQVAPARVPPCGRQHPA